nr:S26 family signal peptidase [Pseudomonas otitidis]
MGDNRDGSNGSRFIGQVAVSELTGKVTGIWYSADQERTGTNFE